jgi:hypothetical protein
MSPPFSKRTPPAGADPAAMAASRTRDAAARAIALVSKNVVIGW